MKKDTRESGRTTGYFRYALAAFTALLVLSLGFALIPRPVPEPAAPPFSEQARAAALAETMRLRAAGQQLAEGSSGARRQAFSRTVTLLTIQARALFLPSDDPSRAAADRPAGAASGSAPASAGASAAAPATTAPATAAPATAQALVAGLSASGKLRLAHAQTADGGMARLLSSVGTAQLLQAAALAQASGTPAPAMPSAAALPAAPALPSATALPSNSALPSASTQAPAPSASCQPSAREGATDRAAPPSQAPANSAAPAASGTEATLPASDASTADALAQVVRTELETVYGYQVALTRLEGPAVQQATDLLSRHEAAVTEAEAHSRLSCAEVPPREPGYTLDATFLNNPTAGLASLEAGTLPVYGDLVALSEGATRQWAIASLVAAAQRTVRWGSDPGPVPGLVLDTSQLPALPETAAPSPAGTALPAPAGTAAPSPAGTALPG